MKNLVGLSLQRYILQLKYFHYFGVADGHGEWGHLVSNLIKQKMPETLQSELNINFKAYH